MGLTQNAAGRRIETLLDANSFIEIGAQVAARSTDFNLSAAQTPSDGVITGFGTIDGSLVYIFSQDVTVLGGTIGEMQAKKITRLYSLARKTGAPVIGIIDCGGVRLEESTDALNALGRIMRSQVLASGVVPQITAVFGNCGGGLSLVPALSDFTFIETENAHLFVNSPDAIEGNNAGKLETSGADYQLEQGHVDFAGTETEVLDAMRQLVALLPLNCEDEGAMEPTGDDLNRACTGLAGMKGNAADMLRMISDSGIFFETKRGYATDMVTGFIRLNGYTIGAVANRGDAASLQAKGVRKAAGFIRFCDAFNIPVLTLANAQTFENDMETESILPDAGARLVSAYVNATVPKVTVITGKAYGSAYILMGSKAVGADMVFAWPDSEVGVMDPKMAAKIMCDGADAATLKKTAAAYSDLQQNVTSAARHGYVDTIISDADTRKYVIGAFEMLYTKREDRPDKKHGTI